MFWACLGVRGLRWRLLHQSGTSRHCRGCCSTTRPGLLQLLGNSSAACALQGLPCGCGIADGRSRTLLLLLAPWGSVIGGGRGWALLLVLLPWGRSMGRNGDRGSGALLLLRLLVLPWGRSIGRGSRWHADLLLLQLLLLLVLCVIGHGGGGSGTLLLLQLLVPPVGCNISRSAGATLCACPAGGIIWQWGPGERCLARPLLSTRVLCCWRLAAGLVCCFWRPGLPGGPKSWRRGLPLLQARGLWGKGLSLNLLAAASSRAGGAGSMTLAVLRSVRSLRDLRMGS